MVISVQFKNRDMEFRGKTYDFELAPNEPVPTKGAIIRMTDPNGKKVCNYTRVKVVDVKNTSDKTQGLIRCVPSSMDEPSIAKR
jgi:hypothetical protein